MERWSNVSNEDIRSGKYVFRDIFDIYDYLHIKSGWSFGWYAAPNFEIIQLEYIINNYHNKYPGSFPDSHR